MDEAGRAIEYGEAVSVIVDDQDGWALSDHPRDATLETGRSDGRAGRAGCNRGSGRYGVPNAESVAAPMTGKPGQGRVVSS